MVSVYSDKTIALFDLINFIALSPKNSKLCFHGRYYVDKNSFLGAFLRSINNENQSQKGNKIIRRCCEDAETVYKVYGPKIIYRLIKVKNGIYNIIDTYKGRDDVVNHLYGSIDIINCVISIKQEITNSIKEKDKKEEKVLYFLEYKKSSPINIINSESIKKRANSARYKVYKHNYVNMIRLIESGDKIDIPNVSK